MKFIMKKILWKFKSTFPYLEKTIFTTTGNKSRRVCIHGINQRSMAYHLQQDLTSYRPQSNRAVRPHNIKWFEGRDKFKSEK